MKIIFAAFLLLQASSVSAFGWEGPVRCTDTRTPAVLDVVLVLDGSGSISPSNWEQVKGFARDVVNSLDLGAGTTNVAAVQFSASVRTIHGLTDSASSINAAITAESQFASSTNTLEGVTRAETILNSSTRSEVNAKAIILVTDGVASVSPAAKMDQLRQQGVTIVGIGVGSNVDPNVIKTWVSTPADDHYFGITDFTGLGGIIQDVVDVAC